MVVSKMCSDLVLCEKGFGEGEGVLFPQREDVKV
jgi:hypothetical protein